MKLYVYYVTQNINVSSHNHTFRTKTVNVRHTGTGLVKRKCKVKVLLILVSWMDYSNNTPYLLLLCLIQESCDGQDIIKEIVTLLLSLLLFM